MKALLSSIILLISISSHSMTGEELATKVYNSNREVDTIQTSTMTLIDKSGNQKERKFTTLTIDNNKYDAKSLVVFTHPKKIHKTSMLTFNQAGDNSIQWLYLPALKKTRKIASSKKSGRFVGSDVFYEDLENREVSLDNHKFIKTLNSKNGKVHVIESRPKNKSTSSYTKTISYIDPNKWIVKKVDFFTTGKKPLKTLIIKESKKYGNSWIVTHTEVLHHKLKHKTVIKVQETKLNNGLKDQLFNKSSLENQNKIKRYL